MKFSALIISLSLIAPCLAEAYCFSSNEFSRGYSRYIRSEAESAARIGGNGMIGCQSWSHDYIDTITQMKKGERVNAEVTTGLWRAAQFLSYYDEDSSVTQTAKPHLVNLVKQGRFSTEGITNFLRRSQFSMKDDDIKYIETVKSLLVLRDQMAKNFGPITDWLPELKEFYSGGTYRSAQERIGLVAQIFDDQLMKSVGPEKSAPETLNSVVMFDPAKILRERGGVAIPKAAFPNWLRQREADNMSYTRELEGLGVQIIELCGYEPHAHFRSLSGGDSIAESLSLEKIRFAEVDARVRELQGLMRDVDRVQVIFKGWTRFGPISHQAMSILTRDLMDPEKLGSVFDSKDVTLTGDQVVGRNLMRSIWMLRQRLFRSYGAFVYVAHTRINTFMRQVVSDLDTLEQANSLAQELELVRSQIQFDLRRLQTAQLEYPGSKAYQDRLNEERKEIIELINYWRQRIARPEPCQYMSGD